MVTMAICVGLLAEGSRGFEFPEYKEVMRGFLHGLGVDPKYDEHLLKCLTDQKRLEVEFVETMNKIDKLDFTNLPLTADLLVDLYAVVVTSVVEIDLCSEPNDEYDKLFQKIYHLSPQTITKRLMLAFISNPQQIFKDLQDAIDNYLGEKFLALGLDLGDIMHMVLLYKAPKPGLAVADYTHLVEGLFRGLKIAYNEDAVARCIGILPNIARTLRRAVKNTQPATLTDLSRVLEAMKILAHEISGLLSRFKLCIYCERNLKLPVLDNTALNNVRLQSKIRERGTQLLTQLGQATTHYFKREYESFGQTVGTIISWTLLE